MQTYTYKPLKVKVSTKPIHVLDEKGNVVCTFKRVYQNAVARWIDIWLEGNYFVQFDVFAHDGKLLYQGKKIPGWGRSRYTVKHYDTAEEYHVSYRSWQAVAPEFRIQSKSGEYVVKKTPLDWAKFYYRDKEVARWKMKTTDWFTCYLEIEDDCPIRDPEFFICLFQCIFYVGD